MATLSYPGVYMEEVSSGVRPIAAAGSSTAAFVGLAQKGPDDEAIRVTNWTEFQKYYGTFIEDSYFAESVFQFFNNGGQQCYILRVTPSDADAADVTVENRAPVPVTDGLKFSAKSKGQWGNSLCLQIENGSQDPGDMFKISVRVQEDEDMGIDDLLKIAALEVYDNLSIVKSADNYVEKVVNSHSNLIDVEVLSANTSLQRGIHRGGFAPAVPPDTLINPKFRINVDHDGYQTVQLTTFAPGALLSDVAAAVEAAVLALTPLKSGTQVVAFTAFTCTVETVGASSRLVLESGTNTGVGTEFNRSSVLIKDAAADNMAGYLNIGETNGGLSEDGRAVRRPANADLIKVGIGIEGAPISSTNEGTDGTAGNLVETDFSNKFNLLDPITDFSLLAVPGIGTSIMLDEGMNYCSNRSLQDVFYIGEMEQDTDQPAEAEDFRVSLTQPNSYGAVYFPWIKSLDPSGKSAEPVLLPPSGYIAGLYARIDSNRGVWKAPAGTEAALGGAVGLAANLTDVQQGNLNLLNVNCIRSFAGSGIVSWGARTITSDAEWTYVPVRRTAIMLRVSIYNGIQWAVFEPNDGELWGQIRLNLNSFMMTLFRKGAFQGSSPADAFFVKCDAETTTQDDINLGIVNVLVGFAPLKPAEFVVVKISQKAGQTS